jgi:hypothetical protein
MAGPAPRPGRAAAAGSLPAPWWRWPLWVLGAAALAFGLQRLLSGGLKTAPDSSLTWMLGLLVGHDAVLAPLVIVVGVVLVRALRRRPAVIRTIAGGLFVAACLTLVALPALLSDGAPDNATATPRDYGAGLAIAVGVDAVLTVAVVVVLVLRRRRR